MARDGANGSVPAHAWTVADRLGKLEDRTDAVELRLDTIEDDRRDRKRRLDDLGGYARAIRSIFVAAAAVSAAVLAWLNYVARH